MFFTSSLTSDSESSQIRRRKGTIIGAGQVGLACAYSMLIQNTLDELVLVDINQKKLEGEVMDLLHGLPFVEPTILRGGTLEEATGSDIVIITAGAKQRQGESRLSLVQRNVELFKSLIPDVVKHCPDAILLLVSNPVDILTYVTLKLSNFPKHRVLGSGTVLDTARFRHLIAQKYNLDPRHVHGYIIGEHGDSAVAVWSKLTIAGTLLDKDEEGLEDILSQVTNAAYEIIQRKGATSYAIGLGVTQIVQAILRDQNRVLTVSHLIQGLYGLEEICLSLPAVVNAQGVTRLLKMSLSSQEEQQLKQSSQTLRQVIDQLDLNI